jgi:hypothetical protein
MAEFHSLRRELGEVETQILEIAERWGISSVEEMEALYEMGLIEEADSWRDYQRLDHLEYNQNRIRELIDGLEWRNDDTSNHH